tara:strand:- start:1996 stop:2367 length:372 start_codon:yes stop_codon:yes gene_type:complete
MNIDLNYILEDLNGETLLAKKDCIVLDKDNQVILKEGVPDIIRVDTRESLTAKSVCVNALLGTNLEEATGESKHKRWELAKKIEASNGTTSLEKEDVVLLKDLIGTAYNPLVVGQLYNILKTK